MKDRTPLKFRILATSLHAIGAMPIMSIIAIGTSIMMFERNLASMIPSHVKDFIPTSLHYLLIEPVTSETVSNIENVSIKIILISTIVTILMWRMTRQIHPFIDIAGKDAINYMLNAFSMIILCILLSMLALFLITGGNGTENMVPIELGFVTSYFIAISHFINSIVISIFVMNGYRFKNRLIYSFIQESI
jgi:uncharacterized Tic20 family protein